MLNCNKGKKKGGTYSQRSHTFFRSILILFAFFGSNTFILCFVKKLDDIISPFSALFVSKGLGCGVGGMLEGVLGGFGIRCVSWGDGGLVILITGIDNFVWDGDIFARW